LDSVVIVVHGADINGAMRCRLEVSHEKRIVEMTDDKIFETVTVTREVPMSIRDLVVFAKTIAKKGDIASMTDEELMAAAYAYWQRVHGED
jgi:hypothetical protein